MKSRNVTTFLTKALQDQHEPQGRIVVLTGARQTGKTTFARTLLPDYQFLPIEDPVLRQSYARLTAAQWKELYPKAILDEVQKEPQLVEGLKSVYDQWPEPRYILTGSSQLLLTDKLRESLAGRCTIVELYPLTLPELETESWQKPVQPSFFQ
ncbi:MAG TPA: AAA family ATPase [Spirochaetales bacterium]|nr:AAA family ATPase [Spirochaetales bacterium]